MKTVRVGYRQAARRKNLEQGVKEEDDLNSEKRILELDKYECGVIFHSLKDQRNQMLKEGKPTEAVEDVLLKVIELIEEPPPKEKRGRRRHEER